MQILIKYHYSLAELIQKEEEYIELEKFTTIDKLFTYLGYLHGEAFTSLVYRDQEKKMFSFMLILNNECINDFNVCLEDGDELMMLPRIGGG